MTLTNIILTLHILGAGVLVGVVFLSLVLVLKPATDNSTLARIRPYGLYAAIWLLVTGIILALPEWDKIGHNKVFWAKIILFVVDGIIAERLINRKIQLAATGQTSADLRLWSWISLLVVISIVGLAVILVEN